MFVEILIHVIGRTALHTVWLSLATIFLFDIDRHWQVYVWASFALLLGVESVFRFRRNEGYVGKSLRRKIWSTLHASDHVIQQDETASKVAQARMSPGSESNHTG